WTNGIPTAAYFLPAAVQICVRTSLYAWGVRASLSSRSICRYRIIAGAPGAFGSPVTFNSWGLTGSHSSPSLIRAQNNIATRATKMTAIEVRRLECTMNHRVERGKRTQRDHLGKT